MSVAVVDSEERLRTKKPKEKTQRILEIGGERGNAEVGEENSPEEEEKEWGKKPIFMSKGPELYTV